MIHSEILVRKFICIFHIIGIGMRARRRSLIRLNTCFYVSCGYAKAHGERTRVEQGCIPISRLRVAMCIPVTVSVCLFFLQCHVAYPVGGRKLKSQAACTGLHCSNKERTDPIVNKTKMTKVIKGQRKPSSLSVNLPIMACSNHRQWRR
jgi:hypothetical protein